MQPAARAGRAAARAPRWQGWRTTALRFDTPQGRWRCRRGHGAGARGASWRGWGPTGWWPCCRPARSAGALQPSTAFRRRLERALRPAASRASRSSPWPSLRRLAPGGRVRDHRRRVRQPRLRRVGGAARSHRPRTATLELDTDCRIAAGLGDAGTGAPRARARCRRTEDALHLSGVKAGLLWEWVAKDLQAQPERFAALIKALPIRVTAPRPVAEAISTAGGVRFEGWTIGLNAARLPASSSPRDARLEAHRRLPATACFQRPLPRQGAVRWLAGGRRGGAARCRAVTLAPRDHRPRRPFS